MARQIQIEEAEKNFNDIISKFLPGDEVIVLAGDHPVAKITSLKKPEQRRRIGTARGQVFMEDDFKDIPDCFEEYVP